LARGGTVSHCIAGVGVDADFGFGTDYGFGCSLSCSFGLGYGCCCCGCWHSSGPSSRVVSACWAVSSPPPSVLAVASRSLSLSSRPCPMPLMVFAIKFVIPAHHTLSSSQRESDICSLSCIHVMIASRCASSQVARASTRFARCPTVQCSCVSSCACCDIVLPIPHLQSLGATGTSLHHLRFAWSLFSIRSKMVAYAVSTAMDVTAVAISIASSIGASLFLFSASPASRSLLPLTLNSGITSMRQDSHSLSSLAHWPTRRVSRDFYQAFTRTHSVVWIPVRTLLLRSRWCWDAHSGVNLPSRNDCRCSFFNCSCCCRLIALCLFRQDFCLLACVHNYQLINE
jgi:hypothetical protein